MIYEVPSISDRICQGDIFIGLPRIDFSLNRIVLIDEQEQREVKWTDIAQERDSTNIIASIRSVSAIVTTQDCDAVRAPDITLCEIQNFEKVSGNLNPTNNIKTWINIIIQQSRANLKWFYLPPDPAIGFNEKMGADFRITLRIPREDLESFKALRKARLIDTAEEHFRERLSEFYRRYPYNEWYPLDKTEFDVYKQKHSDVMPYKWQHTSDGGQQNTSEPSVL